jgi:hypothetical protein
VFPRIRYYSVCWSFDVLINNRFNTPLLLHTQNALSSWTSCLRNFTHENATHLTVWQPFLSLYQFI